MNLDVIFVFGGIAFILWAIWEIDKEGKKYGRIESENERMQRDMDERKFNDDTIEKAREVRRSAKSDGVRDPFDKSKG